MKLNIPMRRSIRYYRPKRKQLKKTTAPLPKRKQARVQIRMARKIVAFTFLAVAVIWFVFFFLASQNLTIKTVQLHGIQTILTDEINAIIDANLNRRRYKLLSNRNLLLFSKDLLKQDIAAKYLVEKVDIDKQFPFVLDITIQEKLARTVLRAKTLVKVSEDENALENDAEDNTTGLTPKTDKKTAEIDATIAAEGVGDETDEKPVLEPSEPLYTESLYYLDVNGIVVSSGAVTNEDLVVLPIIEMEFDTETSIKPGDNILNRETIEYIFSVYEGIESSHENIDVVYVAYSKKTPNEVMVATREGWRALLSAKIALETQIKKLELALTEKIGSDRDKLQYVDLRVKDRVYFK